MNRRLQNPAASCPTLGTTAALVPLQELSQASIYAASGGDEVSRRSDSEARELSGDAQVRWDALKDTVAELVGALDDPDGFSAASAALRQVGQSVDMAEVLNALHVPEDAGEHAAALRRMLLRIPDGWGRWIGCCRGWYPILVDLDEQLAALFPGYKLQQAKEKFGGLRFYWSQGERVTDPADPEPDMPDSGADVSPAERDALMAEWYSACDAWEQRLDRYFETDEGAARRRALAERIKLAEALVALAERRAAVTCELCGKPGRLCCSGETCSWYQTLCASCAERHGYVPAGDNDEGETDLG